MSTLKNLIAVSTAGNSWIDNNPEATGKVFPLLDYDLCNWSRSSGNVVTYVYLPQKGELDIALHARVPSGSSTIEVSVGSVSKRVMLTNTSLQQVDVGSFPVDSVGYVGISMRGIDATADTIAEVPNILIGGSATKGIPGGGTGRDDVYFVKATDKLELHFARRGPSVHLKWQVPDRIGNSIEWAYSELTVPAGQDAIGSYYMANGFAEGYFGIQVVSPKKRQVIFSIWSPYETDDPSKVPPEDRVELLRKGDGVESLEFGNEGAGGQSYLIFPWRTGQTYRFLVRGRPVGNESTEYTGYFYAPEKGEWLLIASFRRPKTHTYLTGLYSFLENFDEKRGQFTRHALYGNQWVRTSSGQWLEITKAEFTCDATAQKGWRLDYQGGPKDDQFYLRNCGFFSDFTEYGIVFERPALRVEPDIDFDELANRPPVFTPIDLVALSENERFLLRIEAKDPDLPSETIRLAVGGIPRFAQFTDRGKGIGELDLRPGYEDSGTYTIDVTATDSKGHTATTTVPITVINVNRPPRLRPIEDQYLYEGQRRRVPISCDNPDRVPVTWATTQLPDFVNFEGHGDGTGVLTIAPSFEEKGFYSHHHRAEYSISITASSPETSEAEPSTETFKIKVCDFKYDRQNRGLITLVSKDASEDQWAVVQWQDRQGKWHDVTGWQGNFDEFIGEAVGAKTWAVVEEHQFGTSPFRWQILQRVGGKSLKTSDPFQLPSAEGDIVFVDA